MEALMWAQPVYKADWDQCYHPLSCCQHWLGCCLSKRNHWHASRNLPRYSSMKSAVGSSDISKYKNSKLCVHIRRERLRTLVFRKTSLTGTVKPIQGKAAIKQQTKCKATHKRTHPYQAPGPQLLLHSHAWWCWLTLAEVLASLEKKKAKR